MGVDSINYSPVSGACEIPMTEMPIPSPTVPENHTNVRVVLVNQDEGCGAAEFMLGFLCGTIFHLFGLICVLCVEKKKSYMMGFCIPMIIFLILVIALGVLFFVFFIYFIAIVNAAPH